MKSEKGVTLTSLVVYIAVLTIVLGTLTLISTFFFNNVNEIKNQEKHAPEFNKFAMFFIQDVKNNRTATVNGETITFQDGNIYTYNRQERQIYRNDTVIAREVKNISYTQSNYTVENTTKNIIQVDISIGENFNKQMEFVLRYW